LDSFKYDFAVAIKEANPNTQYHDQQEVPEDVPNRDTLEKEKIALEKIAFDAVRPFSPKVPEIFHYPLVLALGAVADVVSNGCSSAYEDAKEESATSDGYVKIT
jgi:hypothetical protein